MLKKIYDHSPLFIQESMLAFKSHLLQKHRRGQPYHAYMNDFMRMQWMSRKEIEDYQRDLFRRVFHEAQEQVPYYRKVFGESGFDPLRYEGVADLKGLPILTKEELRTRPHDFENPSRKTIYVAKTGGTTGAPLLSPYDDESMQITYAIQDHYFQTVGIRLGLPCLYLCGQPIVPHAERSRFCRIDRTTHSLFASVHHLSPDTAGSYLRAIRAFHPVWGMGYTSFAFELARHVLERGEEGSIRLAGFMGTSETVTPEMRAVIEKAFGTRLFDFYSSTEGIPFVGQCAAGRYHLHPASGIIECLDERGDPVKPGEPGKLVVTSFKQRKRPLLRFAVNDTGILSADQDCPCGLKWPVIERICGREVEWVVNRQGKRISQFSHQIFKVVEHVQASQIEQFGVERFLLRLVVPPEWRGGVREAVLSRFPEVLGHVADLHFEFLDSIPRTAGGKCPTVISHVLDAMRMETSQ